MLLMKKLIQLIKHVTVHGVMLATAVLVSITAYELILAIAQPVPQASHPVASKESKSTNVAEDTMKPSKSETKSAREPESDAANKPATTHGIVCESAYYAIFNTAEGTACARNPTPLMSHWGPPSAEWFRSQGGRFEVRPRDTTSRDLCACLASQGETAAQEGVSSPVETLFYGERLTAINRWVCADNCATKIADGS